MRGVLLALAVAPALFTLWVIAVFGVNVPVLDDWSYVTLLPRVSVLGVDDFLRLHNESRPALLRLVWIAVVQLAGFSMKYFMLCSWAAAVGISFFVHRLALATSVPREHALWLLVPANLLIFSLVQSANWLAGVQLVVFLTLLMLVVALALIYGTLPVGAKCFGAILLCVLGSLSMASGLLLWPILFAVFVLRCWGELRSARWLIGAFALAGFAFTSLYFRGYAAPRSHASVSSLNDAGNIGSYFVLWLGNAFGSASGMQAAERVPAATAAGVALLLLLAAAGAALVRRADVALWRRAAPWLAMIAFALGCGVLTTWGRAGAGVEQALAVRYATWPLYVAVGLIYGVYLIASDTSGVRFRYPHAARVFVAAVALLLFVLLALGSVQHFEGLAAHRQQRLGLKSILALVNVVRDPETSRRLFPWPDRLRMRASRLDALGLLDPPLISSARVETFAGPRSGSMYGAIEQADVASGTIQLRGWAALPARGEAAHAVLICYSAAAVGPRVVAVIESGSLVSADAPGIAGSGWLAQLRRSSLPGDATRLTAWAFDALTHQAYQLNTAVDLAPD